MAADEEEEEKEADEGEDGEEAEAEAVDIEGGNTDAGMAEEDADAERDFC